MGHVFFGLHTNEHKVEQVNDVIEVCNKIITLVLGCCSLAVVNTDLFA